VHSDDAIANATAQT